METYEELERKMIEAFGIKHTESIKQMALEDAKKMKDKSNHHHREHKNNHFTCAWCGKEKPLNQERLVKSEQVCKSCLAEATNCQRCGVPIRDGVFCEICYGDLFG